MKIHRSASTAVFFSAAALLAGVTSYAGAQSATGASDQTFVRKALQGGAAEVELGRLAAQKAASPDIREFGQKMVQDHTRLGNEMKQVAMELGVKSPAGLPDEDREALAQLTALSGAQFDNAYIRDMVLDHQKDEAAFRREADTGHNPRVKQAARQGEQVISGHLQLIEQIAHKHHVEVTNAESTSR